MVDTGATSLYQSSLGPPLNETLDGRLLARFGSGRAAYDALHLRALAPKYEWTSGEWAPMTPCTCGPWALSKSGPVQSGWTSPAVVHSTP